MVLLPNRRLDAIFAALADGTRRAVLIRLRQGQRSVGELAQPFAMSLTGFSKHLRILEAAGLIERWKGGRVVQCRLRRRAAKDALEWLERHGFSTTPQERLVAWPVTAVIGRAAPHRPPRPAERPGASGAPAPRPRRRVRLGRT